MKGGCVGGGGGSIGHVVVVCKGGCGCWQEGGHGVTDLILLS